MLVAEAGCWSTGGGMIASWVEWRLEPTGSVGMVASYSKHYKDKAHGQWVALVNLERQPL